MRELDMVKKYHKLEVLLEGGKNEEKRYLVSMAYSGRYNLDRFYCSLLDELEPGEVLTERDLQWLIEAYYARKEQGYCKGWTFNEKGKYFENNCVYNGLSYGYKYITFVEAGRSLEEVAGIIAKWLWENRDKEFEVYYTDEIAWEISGEVCRVDQYYGERSYYLEEPGWFFELFRVEGVPPFNYQCYSKPRFVPGRKYICKLKKTEKRKRITYRRLEEKVKGLLEKTLSGFARYEGFYKVKNSYSVWGWVLEEGWELYESEDEIELYRKWAGDRRQEEGSLVIRIREAN